MPVNRKIMNCYGILKMEYSFSIFKKKDMVVQVVIWTYLQKRTGGHV